MNMFTIEFIQRNPKLVQVTRDGEQIGWLNRTKKPDSEADVMWSGIVDNCIVNADTLCGAKRQVRNSMDGWGEIGLTEAGIRALGEHIAAARGTGIGGQTEQKG
jgi:hypothetical protein